MPAQEATHHPLPKISFLLEAEVGQSWGARGQRVKLRSSPSLGKRLKTKLQSLQVLLLFLMNAHAHDGDCY